MSAQKHFVTGQVIGRNWEIPVQVADFAMGCFWGAERLFWELDGVLETSVGYQGGNLENPGYHQVCAGGTAHTESVRVVFDPARITYARLLEVFWENHDPTQGNRQGNDVGEQYRSAIFPQNPVQEKQARQSLQMVQELLNAKGFGTITTQITNGARFWLAEEDHQQYLAKNPGGYCSIAGTGISCAARNDKS